MTSRPERRISARPPGASRPWLGRIARVSAIGLVLSLVLSVRVVAASRAELQEADTLRARGEVEASVAHYRRAARWYAPGNPYCRDALGRLEEIAREAERAGDRALALAAHRSIRGALLGWGSF